MGDVHRQRMTGEELASIAADAREKGRRESIARIEALKAEFDKLIREARRSAQEYEEDAKAVHALATDYQLRIGELKAENYQLRFSLQRIMNAPNLDIAVSIAATEVGQDTGPGGDRG